MQNLTPYPVRLQTQSHAIAIDQQLPAVASRSTNSARLRRQQLSADAGLHTQARSLLAVPPPAPACRLLQAPACKPGVGSTSHADQARHHRSTHMSAFGFARSHLPCRFATIVVFFTGTMAVMTIIIQGSSMPFVLKYLGLTKKSPAQLQSILLAAKEVEEYAEKHLQHLKVRSAAPPYCCSCASAIDLPVGVEL